MMRASTSASPHAPQFSPACRPRSTRQRVTLEQKQFVQDPRAGLLAALPAAARVGEAVAGESGPVVVQLRRTPTPEVRWSRRSSSASRGARRRPARRGVPEASKKPSNQFAGPISVLAQAATAATRASSIGMEPAPVGTSATAMNASSLRSIASSPSVRIRSSRPACPAATVKRSRIVSATLGLAEPPGGGAVAERIPQVVVLADGVRPQGARRNDQHVIAAPRAVLADDLAHVERQMGRDVSRRDLAHPSPSSPSASSTGVSLTATSFSSRMPMTIRPPGRCPSPRDHRPVRAVAGRSCRSRPL